MILNSCVYMCVKDWIVVTCLAAFQLCVLVWQQRSNIFAPPDGGLTCLVCESNTAASLAEPTSNPLTTICDDTWWYNHNRSSGKQKADKTNIFQNWFCVDKRVSRSLEMWSQDGGFGKWIFWHGVCASGRHLAWFEWHHWSLLRYFRQPIRDVLKIHK